ncbi:FliH/SctL family protein [Polynucleobacter sp. AP-Sanab-80-C2]|uniref:FliH/SctL family protein n=1 Tax=Polynucleobacter sp. AP-Sanab-80-C2 TaxID=3108274 RepID=UPI002B227DF1|nr:FliH/SctL family protein [Polynucleobacter sp. AP-Sanab-80-C2]MEA9599066.1 FliH/SctL family protein [Polynucleobacter sp. AP-Sanab-80-C2]
METSRAWPKAIGESFFSDLIPTKPAVKPEPSPAQSMSFSPEKIKEILDKAYLDGYDRGMKSGHEAGMNMANEKLAVEQADLKNLMNGFSNTAKEKSKVLCEDVLALSLDIAKAMLKEHLKINQEAILPILRQATNSLIDSEGPLHLKLNPEDVQIVQKYLQAELSNWQIEEDIRIERGACIIETSGNTVDATHENRWRLICDALGQNHDWLVEKS